MRGPRHGIGYALVEAVPLHRDATCLTDGLLKSLYRLLLWCSCSCHVEDLLFDDGAMKVINSVTEGKLRERESKTDPISGDVRNVIEEDVG